VDDKWFDRCMGTAVALLIATIPLAVLFGIAVAAVEEINKPAAPTYHCDGPGYPAPGTAEARACWIKN